MLYELNIGLDRNSGGRNSVEATIAALRQEGLKVLDWRLDHSDTEPTLVVEVTRRGGWKKVRGSIYGACLPLAQDCVAVVDPRGNGHLIGPKSDRWLPFNPAFFIPFNDA